MAVVAAAIQQARCGCMCGCYACAFAAASAGASAAYAGVCFVAVCTEICVHAYSGCIWNVSAAPRTGGASTGGWPMGTWLGRARRPARSTRRTARGLRWSRLVRTTLSRCRTRATCLRRGTGWTVRQPARRASCAACSAMLLLLLAVLMLLLQQRAVVVAAAGAPSSYCCRCRCRREIQTCARGMRAGALGCGAPLRATMLRRVALPINAAVSAIAAGYTTSFAVMGALTCCCCCCAVCSAVQCCAVM